MTPDLSTAPMLRASLSQQIYQRLRLALMAGRFKPGIRLSLSGLAEQFGTSVTPIREAVLQLVREQALELRPGHQPRVPELDIGHYIETREVRMPLERMAAERAAEHAGGEEIEALASLHDEYVRREDAGDWAAALAANQRFHFGIYAAARNTVLRQVLENFWLISGPFIANQYPEIRNARVAPHPHALLLDALRRRDAAAAGEALVSDLRIGSEQVLNWLQRHENVQAAVMSAEI